MACVALASKPLLTGDQPGLAKMKYLKFQGGWHRRLASRMLAKEAIPNICKADLQRELVVARSELQSLQAAPRTAELQKSETLRRAGSI